MSEKIAEKKKKVVFSSPYIWAFTTYFTEGLPYMIVRSMSFVFFTDIGFKERYLGYLNFLGLPWNLKLLWAPFVDIFGSKRSWIIIIQICISIITGIIACICFMAGNSSEPQLSTSLLVGAFIILAFISATNDIAIDGYYMEGLTDPKEQAAYTGYRVLAYRLSMILARFGFIYLAAYTAKTIASGNLYTAWGYAFSAASLVMAVFTIYHIFSLPEFEKTRKTINGFSSVADNFITSFAAYLAITEKKTRKVLIASTAISTGFIAVLMIFTRQPMQSTGYGLLVFLIILLFTADRGVAISLLAIVFYKIGDEILFSMGTPFLMRELHVTKGQLAWMAGLAGAFGSIAGTSIGGLWIKRKGLKKAIWPLTLLMNINIWAYIWLAYSKPAADTMEGLITISVVYCYEQIAAGLGNAVLIVFILRTCKPQFKAAHYAIGSAFMSLFSTVFGGFSGIIVEKTSYLTLFMISFLATIPSMLLLLKVKINEEKVE